MSVTPDPDPRDGIEAERVAHETAAREQRHRAEDRLQTAGLIADQHVLQTAVMAGLAASAQDLKSVAEDLARASRLSRLERLVLFATGLVLVALVAVVGYGVLRLNGLAETNRANGQTVVDCTQPGGACYQRAQDQTAAAVAQLNMVTIIATECADTYHGARLHTCIVDRIKAGR